APPVTGSVTGSVIAYNGPNVQIYEADCPATTRSAITYTGNTISSGSAITYRGLCYAPSPTVASFNALAGKASGNVDAAPSFAHFLAAPATIMPGSAGVLGWCVIGVASATLSPGGSPVVVPDGATDVSPAASTTYSLQSGAQTLATLGVTVACDAVGMPVAHSPARGQH